MTRRLLLAGCGHSHLFVLESLARNPVPGLSVALVSPAEEYYYSGMVPGVLAGQYLPEDARFSPPKLARAARAEWACTAVVGLEPDHQAARLADGSLFPFDLISFDIGSRLLGDDLPGVREHATPVKPMRDALQLTSRVTSAARSSRGGRASLVIVGGGAAGVELAFCLQATLERTTPTDSTSLHILHAGDAILSEYSESFRARAMSLLEERGITVHCDSEVTGCDPMHVHVAGGGSLGFDTLVWATGPRAPSLFRESGLATDPAGYLSVDHSLRSSMSPSVFGAGDCVSIVDYPWVPKAGVYAVRQGPVLAHNVRCALENRPPKRYVPQGHWLSLMNTGDGRALLRYRGISAYGGVVWRLKDAIDRRFVRRFQALERGE